MAETRSKTKTKRNASPNNFISAFAKKFKQKKNLKVDENMPALKRFQPPNRVQNAKDELFTLSQPIMSINAGKGYTVKQVAKMSGNVDCDEDPCNIECNDEEQEESHSKDELFSGSPKNGEPMGRCTYDSVLNVHEDANIFDSKKIDESISKIPIISTELDEKNDRSSQIAVGVNAGKDMNSGRATPVKTKNFPLNDTVFPTSVKLNDYSSEKDETCSIELSENEMKKNECPCAQIFSGHCENLSRISEELKNINSVVKQIQTELEKCMK